MNADTSDFSISVDPSTGDDFSTVIIRIGPRSGTTAAAIAEALAEAFALAGELGIQVKVIDDLHLPGPPPIEDICPMQRLAEMRERIDRLLASEDRPLRAPAAPYALAPAPAPVRPPARLRGPVGAPARPRTQQRYLLSRRGPWC